MKFIAAIILIAAMLLVFVNDGFSQSPQAIQKDTTQKQIQTIKPSLIVGDLYFAIQAFTTIEIKGTEVDPFIEMKNFFGQIGSAVHTNNFQQTDTINFDIPLHIANNALFFIERATLTGGNAERYKRFVEAIIRAVRFLKEPQKK